jgi:allantoicase
MTDFSELLDLAAERLRAAVVVANDEFFAEKENLIKAEEPVFLPHEYTARGKWMDGWESRRRREKGHDFCIVRLGAPGIVRGVVVDTTHFKGNHPQACSLRACAFGGPASAAALLDPDLEWCEILPESPLTGDTKHRFPIDCAYAFDHVRLSIFPDGGVSRLRIHGEPVVRFGRLPVGDGLVDLAAAAHGGHVLAASDMFFGPRHNLVMPGVPRNMGEGWETRRRRGPGHDWVVLALAARGCVQRIEVDTMHFKGNAPASCMIEGTHADVIGLELPPETCEWKTLLPLLPLLPDARHLFIDEVVPLGELTHVRLNIHPDGGIARLALHGELHENERRRQGLRWLNALPPRRAARELLACCGSNAWAARLASARPFADQSLLLAEADRTWNELPELDWLEAFAAHPRIGERKLAAQSSGRWSQAEQSRALSAPPQTLALLAQANRDYEARFGFVFLICASEKSGDEILASLRSRIGCARDEEIRTAAEEQRKITRLRLQRMLSS